PTPPPPPHTLSLHDALPIFQPRAGAQLPSGAADDRFAGLQWRFVRIKYHYVNEGSRVVEDFLGEPWGIDSPAAEQNLSRRVKTRSEEHTSELQSRENLVCRL